MKILLTGSNGMLGRAILRSSKEFEISIDSPSRSKLDLTDRENVRGYLTAQNFDLIIHCAAKVGGIQANIENPLEFLQENLRMDLNLIEIAQHLRTPNLIYMGSSCMYPAATAQPMKESQLLTGSFEETNQSYALAKVVGARMTELISMKYSLNWKTLILSNLYGPNDHFEPGRSHLLAAIIAKSVDSQFAKEDSIEIWGDGSARREFTFVDDVAKFILSNVNDLAKFPSLLNLGSGVDHSVLEYYQIVSSALGLHCGFTYNLSKPSGMKQKLMDSSKAAGLGWLELTPIEKGVAQTLLWYQHNKVRT
jgi:GDP-L-fucose synthase